MPGTNHHRAMAAFFALGSACFFLGPFPGYASLVGDSADAVTFFVGSVLFTAGGAVQSSLAWPGRSASSAGRASWRAAAIQSAGTLFFNVTTFRALTTALSSAEYNRLVWRPDAFGSICFLVSGLIAYRASPRRGWLPRRVGGGWWQPAVNLLGCFFFGVAAVAGYVVPSSGSVLDLALANWTTALGAACFLGCAVDTLHTGVATKMPARRRLRRFASELEADAERRLHVSEAEPHRASRKADDPTRPPSSARRNSP